MRTIQLHLTSFVGDSRFSGDVAGLQLQLPEDARLRVYVVTSQPGGRTAWHSHEHGQLLICIAGRGHVGTRDGAVLDLHPGHAVWTDADHEHWHGAAADQVMTNIAVQTETPGADGVSWYEPLPDAEWRALLGDRS